METLKALVDTINAQRRLRMMAGETHGTWQVKTNGETPMREELGGRAYYPVGYVLVELEAVPGAPLVYRHISPTLTYREMEIGLRFAALALDKDEPGVWK